MARLNALSGAEVFAEDQLFATLDPTTRRIELADGRSALLTDTVGFINKLPTLVIAAFRATLEEIHEATVLVHVLDVTHPNAREHMTTVHDVLEELGADDKPIIVALKPRERPSRSSFLPGPQPWPGNGDLISSARSPRPLIRS